MIKKTVLKKFPKTPYSLYKFEPNPDWKLQFIEWDIDLDKIDIQDSNNYFRNANLVFEIYDSKSSDLNEAGVINMFYDNIFQYVIVLLFIVYCFVYGIL